MKITWADQITPKPVVWAWRDDDGGRIPAGSLSLIAGREGTGKSSFGIWLAARITTGTLPGSFARTPRRVLYVAVEDAWEYTLIPRLMAAGADLSMVGRLDVQDDHYSDLTLSLPIDNLRLEDAIRAESVALVVIDPLMSAIAHQIDTHNNRQVREALDPLVKIADHTGCVILGIAHFNKSSGTDASSLITGSGAFKDVPRSLFGFAVTEDGAGIMSQVKNSLGRTDLPSLAYQLTGVEIPTPSGPTETGRFDLTGRSELTITQVLRESLGGASAGSGKARVDAWLSDYMETNGGQVLAADGLKAAQEAGFSATAIVGARKRLSIASTKEAMEGGWMWIAALDPPEGSEASALSSVDSSDSSMDSSVGLTSAGVSNEEPALELIQLAGDIAPTCKQCGGECCASCNYTGLDLSNPPPQWRQARG